MIFFVARLLCGFRSEICDPKPSPLSYIANEHICGRPLGLRFDKKTGDLYIADAYLGLFKVGPEGGLATSLTTEAEGVPLRFTNDLDIDEEGNVYFTDSSNKYQRRYATCTISFKMLTVCGLKLFLFRRLMAIAENTVKKSVTYPIA